MLKLFLWLRYLRKKKIVFLSIAAVALSVALMMVVDSLFNGYIEALQKSARAKIGDVFLWPRGISIPQYDLFLARLEAVDEIDSAAPFDFGGGLLYLESGDVREVVIDGIQPQREHRFTDWKATLLRQKTAAGLVNFGVPDYPDADGCWLGINIIAEPNEITDEYDLAEVRKLIGRQVVLTTVNADGKRKVVRLRISDIALTQTYFGDKTLYLPLKKLSKIQYGNDSAEHRWATKIKLADGVDAQRMKPVISGLWQQFAAEQFGPDTDVASKMLIRTEQENRHEWYAELHKQMAVVMLIFGVICSVSVLLVFCIFYMIVETRLKDIAIIKSCGASSGSVAFIFAGFGACIGIVGSGLGIVAGYIVTRNVNTFEEWIRIIFGLKLWQASSYMLNTIPNQVNWSAVLPIVLAAVLGCVIGALIPAIVAAKTKPVEILRYE